MKTIKSFFLSVLVFVSLSALGQTTHYVSLSGGNIPPFNTWQIAATNIQAAVNVSTNGDLVLVTNGVYSVGGMVAGDLLTNRVYITNAILVQSVNGPLVTTISGGGLTRCVLMATNSVLSGFTVSGGSTGFSGNGYGTTGGGVVGGIVTNCTITGNLGWGGGGGALGCVLNNCTISGNSAYHNTGAGADHCVMNSCTVTGNLGVVGGGVADSTLTNCLVSGNSADVSGGGAYYCTLNGCRISGNSAFAVGGGASNCKLYNCVICNNSAPNGAGTGSDPSPSICTLVNCTVVSNVAAANMGGVLKSILTNSIVINNIAPTNANYDGSSTFSYSCTTPLAPGPGNIASDPQFVDYAGGNLRLQTNSPCINAGNNAAVVGSTDLDGQPRIAGGTVDMGAYEFQGLPVSISGQPTNLVVPYSAAATFGVVAVGFPPPSWYQWLFNGTNLPGATSNTLTINNVQLSNTGNYQVQVGNGYSSATSQIATLNLSPTITSPFSGTTTIWGTGTTLSVGAVGNGTLTYQWYFNGAPIDGANLPSLSFPSIQFTNGGLYTVVITSPYGSVTNVAAQVIVNPAGVALGFYPGLTISGVAGYSYLIQSSSNLTDLNAWSTQTNLLLTSPVQLWIDTNVNAASPFNSKTFYRILPGQ